jgi:predicted nucleic acid-binding Zn ribbon protein
MAQKKAPKNQNKLTTTQIVFYGLCILMVVAMVLGMVVQY